MKGKLFLQMNMIFISNLIEAFPFILIGVLINKGEDDTEELAVKKMLAAHSILLSVMGVPAIYYHSLLGSKNDYEGLEASGINRRITVKSLSLEKSRESWRKIHAVKGFSKVCGR